MKKLIASSLFIISLGIVAFFVLLFSAILTLCFAYSLRIWEAAISATICFVTYDLCNYYFEPEKFIMGKIIKTVRHKREVKTRTKRLERIEKVRWTMVYPSLEKLKEQARDLTISEEDFDKIFLNYKAPEEEMVYQDLNVFLSNIMPVLAKYRPAYYDKQMDRLYFV